MSTVVDAFSAASGTLYFTARNAAGQWWNGTAFETYNASNIATYAITAASKGTGWYQASLDDAARSYDLRFRAGGSPATSDPVLWTGSISSLLNILRLLALKAVGDATARAELGGTFDPMTDSLEALAEQAANDKGDLLKRIVTPGTGVR